MSPLPGIYASSVLGTSATGAYDALGSVTLSASAASVTFSGIPSTYKHLQIRILARSASTGGSMRLDFNNDSSGSRYSRHLLYADGSATPSFSNAWNDSVTSAIGDFATSSNSANIFSPIIVDILDFSSEYKNKTVRSLSGIDANGSGNVEVRSSAWYSTAPIYNIKLYEGAGSSFATYSTFSLYGVK